jgi:hypothetical protein
MAIGAVVTTSEVRRSSDAAPSAASRHNSALFRRVTAQAMGMEHSSLCLKSHWVPKSSRDTCSNCKRGFGVFHAKHNCRLCGEVVCGACSNKRILFQKKSVRSCDHCVNQSVDSIARFNRRSSESSADSSDDAAEPQPRRPTNGKRNSDSDILPRPATASDAPTRRRGQSLPVEKSTVTEIVYRPVPRVESWRMQLPYVVVFFLMTVAGITNLLALTA